MRSDKVVDVFETLEPYFSDSLFEDDEEKLDILFNIFKRDFCDRSFFVDGRKVKVRLHPYVNYQKDGLPCFYQTYYEKFVHLITREDSVGKKNQGKKRKFVSDRANRIHWIRPIIENWESSQVCCFAFKETKGIERYYFWLAKKSFMVVVEPMFEDLVLVTGFIIDEKNEEYFRKKYINSREIKKPHLR